MVLFYRAGGRSADADESVCPWGPMDYSASRGRSCHEIGEKWARAPGAFRRLTRPCRPFTIRARSYQRREWRGQTTPAIRRREAEEETPRRLRRGAVPRLARGRVVR